MAVQKVFLLNQTTPVNIPSGLVPKGPYNAGTDYAVGDSVDYNGSSYVMYVDAAAGTAPTDTTKWQVLANKGATGDTGADGQGVPAGGTTGQVLAKIDGTDYNTQWSDPSGGGIANVVEDTTPQLGGDLDLNGSDIIGTTNDKIQLKTNTNTATASRLIGMQFTTESAKAAIAFDDENGNPVAWLQAHKYLDAGLTNLHKHFGIEVSDSVGSLQSRLSIPYGYDTTELGFFSSNVNVNSGGALRIVAENGVTKDLQFGLTNSDNLAPDGTNIRWTLRQDATTESGSNVGSDFQIVRYNDSGVAQDAAVKITRSTGLVTTAGNIESNGTTIDLDSATTATIDADRGASTSFASIVLRTAGTDEWSVQLRNDSTNNLYIRDNINGVNILQAAQGATPAVTLGGAWTFSNDAKVPDEAYDATNWNGSLEVPTKNAVRDKIEAMLGSSGITRTIVVTSGSATMGSSASTDYVYFVAGAHTMSLPAASGNTNRYTVKNNHSANITIDTAGAENIEGAASISISPQESVDILSDGTNWFVI